MREWIDKDEDFSDLFWGEDPCEIERDRTLSNHRTEKSLRDTRYKGNEKNTLNRASRKYIKLQLMKY